MRAKGWRFSSRVLLGVALSTLIITMPLTYFYFQSKELILLEAKEHVIDNVFKRYPDNYYTPRLLVDGVSGVGVRKFDTENTRYVGQRAQKLEAALENVGEIRATSLTEREMVWRSSVEPSIILVGVFDVSAVYSSLFLKLTILTLCLMVQALFVSWVLRRALAQNFQNPISWLARRIKREESEFQLPANWRGDESIDGLVVEISNLMENQADAIRRAEIKQKQLEFQANNDTLTQLPNRRQFESKLVASIRRSLDDGTSFALILLDLRNFKFFNDRYGHSIGDEMITMVGRRIAVLIRNNRDVVARLDGDEFAILTEIFDRQDARAFAASVLKDIEKPYDFRGLRMRISATIGLATFPADARRLGDPAHVATDLLKDAIVALQGAKQNKEQLCVFNESMRAALEERQSIEEDLKFALSGKQLEVVYQPKVRISDGRVLGAEALIRWRHPQKGLIGPDHFIPVAEESGMIIRIGEWILRMAALHTRHLQRHGFPGLNVAVNISPVQFQDGNLLKIVARALQRSQLAPQHLELEITEGVVMKDPEEVVRLLQHFRQLGVSMAIDDFGTDYSSLSYLRRFSVDTLKVDKTFVQNLESDDNNRAIVHAVVNLGHQFGMKLVAEGVEISEHVAILRDLDCDIGQGYFFSKPLGFQEYFKWLKAQTKDGDGTIMKDLPTSQDHSSRVVDIKSRKAK